MTARIQGSTGAPYARILSVGSYRPERVVTNAEVCERIDSSDEWIRERSGIVERRYAAEDESVVDLSVYAAEKALAAAGISAHVIGGADVASELDAKRAIDQAARLAARL